MERKIDCLSCDNSFSLPAGEVFDDERVFEVDMLVCKADNLPRLVPEWHSCEAHTTIQTDY